MAAHVAARLLHPSTGEGISPAFSGNAIMYSLVSSSLPYLLPSCPGPPFTTPFWVWRCAASDPLAKYFLYFEEFTRSRCLSL